MRKLNLKQLEEIKGGGCNKWIRRAGRAEGAIQEALIGAFNSCIAEKY